MEATVEKMETQLKFWSSEIDRLVTKTQRVGFQARFDTYMHIDELKALHVIAQSKFDEFRAAEGKEQKRLKAVMKSAWNDLVAAFKKPMP